MAILFPKSKAEWLDLRKQHISSTESAALFGMSPYQTAFELAVLKKEASTEEYESNERMQWGLRLQRAIAEGIAEEYGVKIRAVTGYASLAPECRMGASFDFEIVGYSHVVENPILRNLYDEHGAGVLEIKNVDSWIFKQQWSEVDGETEAPAHIELQVQHQLECISRQWCAIGVLVGGNRQVLLVRERDNEVGGAIRNKVDGFYKLLESGGMPPITLPEDAEIIRRIYKYAEPGSVLDYQETPDEELHKLVVAHNAAVKAKSAAVKHAESTSAALLMAVGSAEKVLFSDFSVNAATVAPTRVEAYERSGYRNLRVYEKKLKGAKI